jgi:hypothetical protein
VGSLAHLLKNRSYIGEITYRGEVHRGEHEPILEPATTTADRELIERHVSRVIIKPQALEVCLVPTGEEQVEDPSVHDPAPCHPPTTTITFPWTAPSFQAVSPPCRHQGRRRLLSLRWQATPLNNYRLTPVGS